MSKVYIMAHSANEGTKHMPTRTAPTVAAADGASYAMATLYFIDSTGDTNTFTVRVPADTISLYTDIENVAASYQAVTNASLYRVDIAYTWRGVADSGNADNAARPSVFQGLNLLYRDTTNWTSQSARIFAPVDGIFISNTDTPDPADTALANFLTAFGVLLSGEDLESMSYSERKETNKRYRV